MAGAAWETLGVAALETQSTHDRSTLIWARPEISPPARELIAACVTITEPCSHAQASWCSRQHTQCKLRHRSARTPSRCP
eukprot:11184508-Alexandrium_andersonii.AAC.1